MKKFNYSDYGVKDIGTLFKISDGGHLSYIVTLKEKDGKLNLYRNDELFNLEKAPYLSSIIKEKHNRCLICNKSAVEIFNLNYYCDHHYKNEVALTKMMITDFLYKVEDETEHSIIKENFDPYIHNEHDLKFPYYSVMHRENNEEYGGMNTYVMYIINENMKESSNALF